MTQAQSWKKVQKEKRNLIKYLITLGLWPEIKTLEWIKEKGVGLLLLTLDGNDYLWCLQSSQDHNLAYLRT